MKQVARLRIGQIVPARIALASKLHIATENERHTDSTTRRYRKESRALRLHTYCIVHQYHILIILFTYPCVWQENHRASL